ncbi:MAG TPA: carboxypeptidase-like regulatory domain-containing protein, partial [Myxococcaceae bacterium]|nr:carboxypeptidase-like regulatory domain-containing protein [Myxococcaceae bacterium]
MRDMRRLVILLGVVVLAGALGYASLPVGTAPSSGPRASAGKARARSGEGVAEARGGLFSSGGLLSGSGGEERRGRGFFSLGGWGLPVFEAEGECWLSGQVTDEDGQPIPGAEVIVRDSEGPFIRSWKSAETDGEGRYRLGPLSPGFFIVEADAPRYVARKLTGQLLSSAEETVDLELRDAVLVEGTVVDEDGRPL